MGYIIGYLAHHWPLPTRCHGTSPPLVVTTQHISKHYQLGPSREWTHLWLRMHWTKDDVYKMNSIALHIVNVRWIALLLFIFIFVGVGCVSCKCWEKSHSQALNRALGVPRAHASQPGHLLVTPQAALRLPHLLCVYMPGCEEPRWSEERFSALQWVLVSCRHARLHRTLRSSLNRAGSPPPPEPDGKARISSPSDTANEVQNVFCNCFCVSDCSAIIWPHIACEQHHSFFMSSLGARTVTRKVRIRHSSCAVRPALLHWHLAFYSVIPWSLQCTAWSLSSIHIPPPGSRPILLFYCFQHKKLSEQNRGLSSC